MGNLTLKELNALVLLWAYERNLVEGSTAQAQLGKLVEEMGEMAVGMNKKLPDIFRDGLGDMLVVMIILAEQNGTSLKECLAIAYDGIKDRKGKMVDGIFIKENDQDIDSIPVKAT